jgi:hypothetical protein
MAIGLAVTLVVTFLAYQLSVWTAHRDFFEICLELEQASKTLSEECKASLDKGVPRPPIVKRGVDAWLQLHFLVLHGFQTWPPRENGENDEDPIVVVIVILLELTYWVLPGFALFRLFKYLRGSLITRSQGQTTIADGYADDVSDAESIVMSRFVASQELQTIGAWFSEDEGDLLVAEAGVRYHEKEKLA